MNIYNEFYKPSKDAGLMNGPVASRWCWESITL